MRCIETPLSGAHLIELEPREDERGFFARLFCEKEYSNKGLEGRFVQVNNSTSRYAKTLRGMHFQREPFAETKLVRCIQGELYDVIVDLRENSPTYLHTFGALLSASNRTMMYVPKGFAHGFLTLTDHVEVLYFVSTFYSPANEAGLRWDDPKLAISWPDKPLHISTRDLSHALL